MYKDAQHNNTQHIDINIRRICTRMLTTTTLSIKAFSIRRICIRMLSTTTLSIMGILHIINKHKDPE